MQVTAFSFSVTFLWVNLFIIILSFIRRKKKTFYYVSLNFLKLTIFLTIVRLFLPIEVSKTIVIESRIILQRIQLFLTSSIAQINIGIRIIDITVITFLMSIWIVVAIACLLKSYFQYKNVYRLFQLLPKQHNKQMDTIMLLCKNILGVEKDIKVVFQKLVASPMIIGYKKPIIILPDITFNDIELKAVLFHELIHYRYKHVALKTVTEIIHSIFWWNPIFAVFKREISNILEMFTDKKVGEILIREEQMKYLEFILKVVKNANRNRQLSSFAFGLLKEDNNSFVYQRFEMLLENNYGKSKCKSNMAFVILSLFLFVTSYSIVLQPHSEPTIYDYLDESDLSDGNYVVGDDSNYILYDKYHNKIANIVITDAGIDYFTIKKEGEKKS